MKAGSEAAQPKTHGSVGLLVIGLGGANGTTMLAGILANRHKINWFGPRGEPMSSNYYGCITQLDSKGKYGGVGFRDVVEGLADANMCAFGGWDIRPTKLGDALLQQQILDYDLVRQVQPNMNKCKVFKGYYDPRFIGTSQHATATYTIKVESAAQALQKIRSDIRYFKWKNGVVGHTTVIWSASVEPNCELVFDGKLETAKELLEAIQMTEEERGAPLSPSLIYATAAILEGCSFVNGGSQNSLCGGLEELAKRQTGVYCLGTDFKAGQTKFKTAAVEYIRTMGLTPKVIASSNHLGNNDMRNLASADKARHAKLRVKHDIFAAWDEDIDHKVSVMFTPMINDEKRDFVEYTSLGFLGQHHTMVTYTRASDSVLCVPLMIDAGVWCDFFSNRSWPYEQVSKAMAYLFKVPEGAAKGVDPGFFKQMDELRSQATSACEIKRLKRKNNDPLRRVRFRAEEQNVQNEWILPHGGKSIICGGLACVDMQLGNASCSIGGEHIETFEGENSIGGGSVSMACKTLARLFIGNHHHWHGKEETTMEAPPPVVQSVIPLCKIGKDDTGNKLLRLLEDTGSFSRNIETKFTKSCLSRDQSNNARTALAVLPIYQDGRRGCFFDAASNSTFSDLEVLTMLDEVAADSVGSSVGAFVFGYPHLLPKLQGQALANVFVKARSIMKDKGITVIDMNGVPASSEERPKSTETASDIMADPVIGAVLQYVDILHLNEDELLLLTGTTLNGNDEEDDAIISSAASLFLQCGVAIIAVTRGKKGCFIGCNGIDRFQSSPTLPQSWAESSLFLSATELPHGITLNTNGAGDAFTSGFLVATLLRHTGLVTGVMNQDKTGIESSLSPEGEFSDTSTNISMDYSFSSDTLNSPNQLLKKKRLTPYTLFMKDYYVALKNEFNGDKKSIFSRCHNLWEQESDEVKAMYRRKCQEELEDLDADEDALANLDENYPENIEDINMVIPSITSGSMDSLQNLAAANGSTLTLEAAANLASLVAAYHIDTSTRNLNHLDINLLLDRVLVDKNGLQEI